MSNKVYYRVNGKEITQDMVHDFVHSMGPQGQNFHNEEGFKQVAEELLNQELFYLDAKENELEKDEDFIKELDLLKDQFLKQYAIRKFLDNVSVTEEEVKEMYENNKESLKDVYKFKASHILVDDEDKAKEIKNKLDNGESFEDLAKEFSKDGSGSLGGSLGEFYSGQMVPEFENALLELSIDEISNPVKSQFGYHIIKLEDKTLERENTYENYKDDIQRNLQMSKQQEEYLNRTNELKDKYKVERVD